MKISKEEQIKKYDAKMEEQIMRAGEVFQQAGVARAFQFMQTMAGIGKVKALMEIQDKELWRDIPGLTGFKDYLKRVVGVAESKFYEDRKNIELFGEDWCAMATSMGISRQEIRLLRTLPEEQIKQLTDGKTIDLETVDKDGLVDLIHVMVKRHQEEIKRTQRSYDRELKIADDEKLTLEKELGDMKIANADIERELNQLTGRKRKKIDRGQVLKKMHEVSEILGRGLRILGDIEIDWDDKEQVIWYKSNLSGLEAALRNIQARKAEERGAWLGIFDDPEEPI